MVNKTSLKTNKYKMYICHHGWVISYDNSVKLSGKRYRFEIGRKKEAIDLSFLEVLGSIEDCNNTYYNNWSFEITNEKAFIKEFKEYKKEHEEELNIRYRYVDKDNPLIHHKRETEVEWAALQRSSFCKADLFGQPCEVTWYYFLVTDRTACTSGVLGFKKTKRGYEFETFNSIYIAKKLLDIPYIDQIKELKSYFKSNSYKEFLAMEEENENQKKNM